MGDFSAQYNKKYIFFLYCGQFSALPDCLMTTNDNDNHDNDERGVVNETLLTKLQ